MSKVTSIGWFNFKFYSVTNLQLEKHQGRLTHCFT